MRVNSSPSFIFVSSLLECTVSKFGGHYPLWSVIGTCHSSSRVKRMPCTQEVPGAESIAKLERECKGCTTNLAHFAAVESRFPPLPNSVVVSKKVKKFGCERFKGERRYKMNVGLLLCV